MFGIGVQELIIIAAIVFLLFGGMITKKLFTNIATGIREGKKSAKEIADAVNQ